MKKVMVMLYILFIFLIAGLSYSQIITDYLITNDIGTYKKITKGGPSGNILAGADHFGIDHKDASYSIAYVNDETKLWVDVQVTQHANSESDKWLLHEVERGFRDNDTLDATYVSPNSLRVINGNRIWYTWGYYRWISNYVVVSVQFADLTGTKPEPLEIVQAYLQKFPSTISSTLVLDKIHTEKWIKDEMDRRLWLCDKWNMQFQLGKVQQKELLDELVRHLNVFLEYREKYYGISAKDDKKALSTALSKNDGTTIKNRLTEYKSWWSVNKGKTINL